MKSSLLLPWCRSWSRRVPILHGILIAQMILMPFPPSSQAVWVPVDADGDGFFETGYDDGTPPIDQDVDMDGLTDVQEQTWGTSPYDPDSDDDGALDGSEVNIMNTNPLDEDSNDNGVLDYTEYVLRQSDSDSDSLTDWAEIYEYFTNKDMVDTDGDGWNDGVEVVTTGTSPVLADTDGDGLTDWDDEIVTSNPSGDFDGDGLSNWQEASTLHSVPGTRTLIRVADSDGDGLNDGYEIATMRYSPSYETKQASSPVLWDSNLENSWSDGEDPAFLFPSDVVVPPVLTITGPSSLPNATLGIYYVSPSFSAANGSGSYTWNITAGNVPPEFSFNGSNLVGSPATAGVYHFTVQVADGNSTNTSDYTLVVEVPELSIVSSSALPSVQVGESVTWQFAASGGVGGYVWSIPYELSPLSLSSDGVLSGSVSSSGSYSFRVRVTDANGTSKDQTVTLTVLDIPPPPVLEITSSSTLSDAQYFGSYSWWFTANNGSGAYTWSIVGGSLPGGLALSSSGELSGTVTGAAGYYAFTIQVTDSSGSSTSKAAVLNVTNVPPPPIQITSARSFTSSIWTPSSIQFNCTPANGALVWYAYWLPSSNFSFDSSTGTLSWTGEGEGTHTITISVSDGYSSDMVSIQLNFVDQDADGDWLNASKEHELALSWNLPMHDGSAYSNGGGSGQAPFDWLILYHAELMAADTLDEDGDGLGSQIEQYLGTDPAAWDSDGDFASDRLVLYELYDRFFDTMDGDSDQLGAVKESILGTLDTQEDSDGDGLTDAWEAFYISYCNPAILDTDGDGLHDGLELDHQTQARAPDSDDDHLTDYEEVNAVSIFQVAFQLSPLDPDSDHDGIPDYAEVDLTDTDGAGIPDRLELHWGLNPGNPDDELGDADSDDVSNVNAYRAGYDIFANWQPQFDDDNDGMDNVYEISKSLNKNDQHDGADDPDGDFLTNKEEYRAKTNPQMHLTPVSGSYRMIRDLDSVSGEWLSDSQNRPVMRPAATDYEQVFSRELVGMARDNGSHDPLRAYDDDWDQDQFSNFDELYPTMGKPSDPRQRDAPLELFVYLQGGSVGQSYSGAITASGGQAPYTFSASGYPSGVTFANGVFSGYLRAAGTYPIHLEVTDNRGAITQADVVLEVSPNSTMTIIPSSLPNAFEGITYQESIEVVGGIGTSISFELDGLPEGLSFVHQGGGTALVSGSTNTLGNYSINVRATQLDENGEPITANGVVAIRVVRAPVTISPSISYLVAPPGRTITPVTWTASGGSGHYTISVDTASPLPAGLQFNPQTATLSGTMPNMDGDYHCNFIATDDEGNSSEIYSFQIKVDSTPPHLVDDSWDVIASRQFELPLTATGMPGGSFTISLDPEHPLPPQLLFNESTNVLSGILPDPGSHTVHLRVGDGYTTVTALLTLQVLPPPLPRVAIQQTTRYVGMPFTAQLSGEEGYGGPYVITPKTDLPGWLSFNAANDRLSGTPPAAGDFYLEFDIEDARQMSNAVTLPLNISVAPPLQLQSAGLTAMAGDPLNFTMGAYGGVGLGHTVQLASGQVLPAGLNYNPTSKQLTGVPLVHGVFPVQFELSDAANNTTQATFTLTLMMRPLTLTPDTVTAHQGHTFSHTFTPSGGVQGPYTMRLTPGQTLPPGISFHASSFTLSGTSSTSGEFSISLDVTDARSNSASVIVPLRVTLLPLALSPSWLMTNPGAPFSQVITPTGGLGAPYTVSLASTLPANLTFNTATRSLSGNLSTPGSYAFDFDVVDRMQINPVRLTFVVSVPHVVYPLGLDRQSLSVNPQESFAFSPSAAGGSGGPYTVTFGGALEEMVLPSGVSFSPETNTFSGAATELGSWSYTFQLSDGTSNISAAFTLIVRELLPLTFTGPEILIDAIQGQPYSYAIQTAGGDRPTLVYQVENSTPLPEGLSLSTKGLLSGTPASGLSGTFPLNVNVSDAVGSYASEVKVLHVRDSAFGFTSPLPMIPIRYKMGRGVSFPFSVNRPHTLPLSFSLASGSSLPAGVMISSTGSYEDSGHSLPRSFAFDLTASDAAGRQSTARFVVETYDPLSGRPPGGQPIPGEEEEHEPPEGSGITYETITASAHVKAHTVSSYEQVTYRQDPIPDPEDANQEIGHTWSATYKARKSGGEASTIINGEPKYFDSMDGVEPKSFSSMKNEVETHLNGFENKSSPQGGPMSLTASASWTPEMQAPDAVEPQLEQAGKVYYGEPPAGETSSPPKEPQVPQNTPEEMNMIWKAIKGTFQQDTPPGTKESYVINITTKDADPESTAAAVVTVVTATYGEDGWKVDYEGNGISVAGVNGEWLIIAPTPVSGKIKTVGLLPIEFEVKHIEKERDADGNETQTVVNPGADTMLRDEIVEILIKVPPIGTTDWTVDLTVEPEAMRNQDLPGRLKVKMYDFGQVDDKGTPSHDDDTVTPDKTQFVLQASAGGKRTIRAVFNKEGKLKIKMKSTDGKIDFTSPEYTIKERIRKYGIPYAGHGNHDPNQYDHEFIAAAKHWGDFYGKQIDTVERLKAMAVAESDIGANPDRPNDILSVGHPGDQVLATIQGNPVKWEYDKDVKHACDQTYKKLNYPTAGIGSTREAIKWGVLWFYHKAMTRKKNPAHTWENRNVAPLNVLAENEEPEYIIGEWDSWATATQEYNARWANYASERVGKALYQGLHWNAGANNMLWPIRSDKTARP
jgi:hypothetical protein